MEFGTYLRQLRGSRSLREIQRISGISYTRIDSLEKGKDPRSGNASTANHETLRKLAEAYNTSYVDLLIKAGYVTREEIALWAKLHSVNISDS